MCVCAVCFSVFDGDCDGWLSREELVAAIAHLTAMRGTQDDATPTTLSNGDASPAPSPAPEGQQDCGKEEIADSILQNYGKTKVHACGQKQFIKTIL